MTSFNQLEAFLILAECLNLTETAQRMHCSQPAMSQKIRALEQGLNAVLFDRIGKRLYLTHQGKEFRVYAAQAVNTMKAAREHLRQMDNPLKGNITFGASSFIGIYLLPRLLSLYRKKAPDLLFTVDITNSHQLLHKLETNDVEFLLLSDHIAFDADRYLLTNFYRDDLVLITSPNHRFAQQGYCQLKDLSDEFFLTKPDGSATHSFLFNAIRAAGVELHRLISISSLEAIKQGVIHELGVSIMSRLAVAHEIKYGTLVEVQINDIKFERGIRIVHHIEKQLSPAATLFLNTLKDATTFSG